MIVMCRFIVSCLYLALRDVEGTYLRKAPAILSVNGAEKLQDHWIVGFVKSAVSQMMLKPW